MRILLIIIIILLTSCKPEDVTDLFNPNKDPYYTESDPYFDPLKREFEKDYYLYTGRDINLSNTIINITNNKYFRNHTADGVCMSKHKEILIRHDAWKNMNEINRKILFYHEVGHCVLDYPHIDYSGIMNPQWPIPTGLWEAGFHDDLLKDFFNPTESSKNNIISIKSNLI